MVLDTARIERVSLTSPEQLQLPLPWETPAGELTSMNSMTQ
jgi:hypothetical protein